MERCRCKARYTQGWAGLGVRVDIQSRVEVKPAEHTRGLAHDAHVIHYWVLSCPHCLMDGGRFLIDTPVKLPVLQELIADFEKNHDAEMDYWVNQPG